MEIRNYRQYAASLEELIQDDGLKEFIFGSKEINYRYVKGINTIKKLVEIGFYIIYFKWLNSSFLELKQYLSTHANNIFELLFSLYKSRNPDLDMYIYVLSEAQRDVKEYGEKSFFNNILSKENFCAYSKLYGLIDDLSKNLFIDTSEEKILVNLINLKDSFAWLTTTKWDCQTNSFILSGNKYLCRDIVYCDENGETFFLKEKSYMLDTVRYEYVSIDGFHSKYIAKKI